MVFQSGAIITRFSELCTMALTFLRHAALIAFALILATLLPAADSKPPLRVVIAGLVHGHAEGFFSHSRNRSDIQIVAIADSDRALSGQYAAKFHLDLSLYHADLAETLRSTNPQTVLLYTSTSDHRNVLQL